MNVRTPFFHHGCHASRWYKWPAVAARRLLRRIQRPFFFSLQKSFDALQLEIAEQRALASATAARQLELAVRLEASVHEQTLFSRGVCTALDQLEWMSRAPRAKQIAGGQPFRVLFAVSSGCQMYSGTGRAIFETVKRLRGAIDYEFAIDDRFERNVKILESFCRASGIPLHIGRAGDGTGDPGNQSLAELLNRSPWDAVECVSFANSCTNAIVLEYSKKWPIIYTPHYQPMSTIPITPEWARQIERVHGELLRRAAVVACDSPWEWFSNRALAGPEVDCALLPLGFEPKDFAPGNRDRQPFLLFVGDLVETRKRFPLVLDVFAQLIRLQPNFRLVVVGNKSDALSVDLPEAVRGRCSLMGYISETELRRLYREASGLIHLSDYEAFGLPILESLACGTPVFLSRRSTVVGLFGHYMGAIFIDDDTPALMAMRISEVLARGGEFIERVLADRPRLIADLSWDIVAEKRSVAMIAAVASWKVGNHSSPSQ